jgi:hypothetical protein
VPGEAVRVREQSRPKTAGNYINNQCITDMFPRNLHWLTEGKGVVLKAGPGPLAEVGKLGISGKTPCTECPCMKPARVRDLEPR